MFSRTIDGIYVNRYSSTSEVLSTDVNYENRSRWKSSVTEKDGSPDLHQDWFGVREGAKKVFEYIETGWADGVSQIEEAVGTFKLPPTDSLRPRLVRGDFGDELDIQEMYQGNLDQAWTRLEPSPIRSGTRYTICVDIGGHCGLTQEDLFWPGAAAYMLAKAAIDAGRPVRVIAYHNSEGAFNKGPASMLASIEVKPFLQRISPDKLALLALSGYWRVVGFKTIMIPPWRVAMGLGRTRNMSKEALQQCLSLTESKQDKLVKVPALRSQKQAQEFLDEQFQELFNIQQEDAA
jgi:hypothetical protein